MGPKRPCCEDKKGRPSDLGLCRRKREKGKEAHESVTVRLLVPPLAHNESDGDSLGEGSEETDLHRETLIENESVRRRGEREISDECRSSISERK